MEYLYQDITGKIIKASYRVFDALQGRLHYPEHQFARALSIELEQLGLAVIREVEAPYFYSGQPMGKIRMDLVVEQKVVVEVKKAPKIAESMIRQVRTYLIDGGYAVGLVVNFGGEQLQYKRFYEARHAPERSDLHGHISRCG